MLSAEGREPDTLRSEEERPLPQPTPGSRILIGDARKVLNGLDPESIQTCITSPPYWGLRDYQLPRSEQVGAEDRLEEYVANLVEVFAAVRRVLRADGTAWLNLGDSYTSGNRTWRAPDRKNPAREMDYRPPTPEGLKPKDLIGVPWRVAFALQADGWYLRSDIVWHKPNCQPESVRDRPTQAHEYLFLLSKSLKYHYNAAAVLEPATDGKGKRNRRSVWSIPTEPSPEAHFATFPAALVQPCILAATSPGDVVLDPFFGSGTVGVVANRTQRRFVGIELNPDYAAIAARRTGAVVSAPGAPE
jgi:site-specific DNA-methyltransferase (adenine-specific)/site-specific DNA-methyltransferase (cytosine-N4-specific)